MANNEFKGNTEQIAGITNFLMQSLELYIKERGPFESLDVYMAAHNFHKLTVDAVAKQLEPQIPYNKTVTSADLTFRRALRELRMPSRS